MKKIFFLAIIVLNSCCTKKQPVSKQNNENIEINTTITSISHVLENTKWQLISMNNNKISPDYGVTLNFGKIIDNKLEIYGQSFVNRFNDKTVISNDKIKLEGGIITLRASLDDEINRLENLFLETLKNELDFKKTENKLTLSQNGKVVLILEETK